MLQSHCLTCFLDIWMGMTHARLLFIDFSSAFNTIQPHILTRRLLEQFELSNNLVGWILDFLTNRTKRVRVNGFFV